MVKRVILAEDEPNIAESLRFLLEHAGFEVTVESSGKAALDAVLAAPPTALVLDIMLPEMDGYDVLRFMRADARGAKVPVLMLSAKGQREDREMAMRCGADVFITKPFGNADVVEAVRRLAED